jgi:hypothetical protein
LKRKGSKETLMDENGPGGTPVSAAGAFIAMFCGCRRLWRRAKRLYSNILFPNFKFGNNING